MQKTRSIQAGRSDSLKSDRGPHVPGTANIVSLLSHELRNPLAVISGLAQTLRTERSHLPERDQDEALAEIASATARLQDVVSSMLLLATPGSAATAEVEPILLQRLLPVLLRRRGAAGAGPLYNLQFPDSLPPVMAHQGFITQVLDNLLDNAAKYGAPGRPIEISVSAGLASVCVAVTNEGSYVSPEEAEMIFEPFFRSAAGRRHASGLGLGLAVCQRLLEAQGGEIQARSRPSGGLTMSFELPIACESDATSSSNGEQPAMSCAAG